MTDLDGTEGLLMNWAQGISTYPVTPVPSQIAQVHQGWTAPMTVSPRARRHLGVDGLPLEAESVRDLQALAGDSHHQSSDD
ncbi:hypothetical protein ABT299_34710 [Spirillospora sp. NPDC000708]